MATFTYAAKNTAGKTVEGTLQANSKGEVVSQLRAQDLIVLRVDGGGKSKDATKKEKAPRPKKGKSKGGFLQMQLFASEPKATTSELVIFTRQLATMISAGISLLEALEVLSEQADTPGMKTACGRLVAELRGGSDFSDALRTCPKIFNTLYVSMVTAGEASGQMDVILDRLAEYVEATDELKREIRSAMTYPVVSLVLVLSITMFLMVGVVPGFKDVFEGLGAELPGLTIAVLAVSDWIRGNWLILMGLTIGSMFGFSFLKKTPQGSYMLDEVMLRVPVFGPLFRKVALARFSRTFATLVSSGVPIMGTLDIVADTAGNQVIARVVRSSRESVRNGNMLSEPLSGSKVFPPMVVRMIAIGERSGALEQLLEKIADFYDSQVKATVKSLTSLIEPILICVMGGLVGVVILSVFLPILNLIGTLSG
ncbi:MAG: type IV pilus assembly protein PilC [Planctomycetota bacterium]